MPFSKIVVCCGRGDWMYDELTAVDIRKMREELDLSESQVEGLSLRYICAARVL